MTKNTEKNIETILSEAKKLHEIHYENIANSIRHNLSDEKWQQFTSFFKQKEEKPTYSTIYGVPVQVSTIVPKDEMWFFNRDGKIIKKFKF